MKVLLLGGTGAMGTHLVGLLAKGADLVAVTTRNRQRGQGAVKYITGNAKDNTFLRTLLKEKWDAVVDFMVYTTTAFEERCALLLDSVEHYVYLSSARVYADSSEPITEDSPRLLDVSGDNSYLATDEYALSKARQENILFSSNNKNWTIIRPYITYSNERLQLGVLEKEDWLYRALAGRTIVISKDIHQKKTTLTHGLDVARGINAILGKKSAQREAFHITSPQTILWKDVLDIYLSVLKKHLKGDTKICLQSLPDFTQWRTGKYQITYDRLYDRQFDNNKMNNYIDTSRFVDPSIGLSSSLEKFIASEDLRFREINWRAEAIKDRMLDERTDWSEIAGMKQKAKYFIFRNIKIS